MTVGDVCCMPAHSGSEVISTSGIEFGCVAKADDISIVTAVPLREDRREVDDLVTVDKNVGPCMNCPGRRDK